MNQIRKPMLMCGKRDAYFYMEKQMTILIPAYNEQDCIAQIIDDVSDILDKNNIRHDFLIVDDGSKDKTWQIVSGLSRERGNIRAVKLSRNFGKEGAIFAGLRHVSADCCVVMDSDGQHPPELLVEMYAKWQQGYHIVEAVKSDRGRESAARGFFARLFYKIVSAATGIDMTNASDYKLLDAKVIKALLQMPEKQTFFRAMSGWTGYQSTKVYFDVPQPRRSKSRWSHFALIKLALNAITSYSSLPMQIVTGFGIIFFIFSLVLMIQTLIMKLSGRAVEGFTTVIILLLIIGSIIMFSLGVIGFYISRIYNEIKSRPRYLIDEKIGFDQEDDA